MFIIRTVLFPGEFNGEEWGKGHRVGGEDQVMEGVCVIWRLEKDCLIFTSCRFFFPSTMHIICLVSCAPFS